MGEVMKNASVIPNRDWLRGKPAKPVTDAMSPNAIMTIEIQSGISRSRKSQYVAISSNTITAIDMVKDMDPR
jgi:hypothetical protein